MDLPSDVRALGDRDRAEIAEALDTLLGIVHRQWYAGRGAKRWMMVRRRWAAILCFPARRFSELGLRLSAPTYVRMLSEQLEGMREKLNPDDYMAPTWAGKFLAVWLKTDGEGIYYRYRGTRSLAVDALARLRARSDIQSADVIEPLAQTHRVITAALRRSRRRPSADSQPTLF
ncbi:MAG TPA: hypothetical protein PLU30_27855 [Verrucomicrobiae bacterium]|nr:hypothetical protein [Verrucomicrobiae bacterium]